jgi:deoxyhypusine synthase
MKPDYQIEPKDSWMVAAAEKTYRLLLVAGKTARWEIFFASYVYKGEIKRLP